MRTPRISIVYSVSLLILGTLSVLVLFRPFATGKEFATVQKEQLLKTKDGWVIQFDLVNQEEECTRYKIRVVVDEGRPYEEIVLVRGGGIFTYVHHIKEGGVTAGIVKITIFTENDTTPIEETTYYLKNK